MILNIRLLHWFIAILLFAFYLSSCQKETQFQGQKIDNIFFLSNRDAPKREFDVFSMDLNGGIQTNLTADIKGVRTFSNPVVSHNKKLVLFVSFYNTKRTIHVLQLSDSTSKPLTEVSIDKPDPRFSPDDQSIIFSDRVNTINQIFKIGINGKNRLNLSMSKYNESEPEFSPDGSLICFTSKRGKKSVICLMKSDGSAIEVLTDTKANSKNPSFSPDGTHIVFASDQLGSFDLYTYNLKSKKISTIYFRDAYALNPLYTPDGKYIIFISNLRGIKYKDIIVINIDTKEVTNLTEKLDHFNRFPVCMPDGRSIVFESVGAMNSEIYQIDINGKNLKNLTNHQKWDLAPAL